jgi:hypothetical protein
MQITESLKTAFVFKDLKEILSYFLYFQETRKFKTICLMWISLLTEMMGNK